MHSYSFCKYFFCKMSCFFFKAEVATRNIGVLWRTLNVVFDSVGSSVQKG